MTRKTKKKKSPLSYRRRYYREDARRSGLVSTFVTVRETDLHVLAPCAVEDEVRASVLRCRAQIEGYIRRRPEFASSLRPLEADPLAPPLAREMLAAGEAAGVGPMAAVAGVIAEHVGRDLEAAGIDELIVENGGDIYLRRGQESIISIHAGQSLLSDKVGLRVAAADSPLGVCCSSGTIGHSLSLGIADAVVVLARSTALADAAATAIGNAVRPGGGRSAMDNGLARAAEITGILGVVIIQDDQLGAWGRVELVRP